MKNNILFVIGCIILAGFVGGYLWQLGILSMDIICPMPNPDKGYAEKQKTICDIFYKTENQLNTP